MPNYSSMNDCRRVEKKKEKFLTWIGHWSLNNSFTHSLCYRNCNLSFTNSWYSSTTDQIVRISFNDIIFKQYWNTQWWDVKICYFFFVSSFCCCCHWNKKYFFIWFFFFFFYCTIYFSFLHQLTTIAALFLLNQWFNQIAKRFTRKKFLFPTKFLFFLNIFFFLQ